MERQSTLIFRTCCYQNPGSDWAGLECLDLEGAPVQGHLKGHVSQEDYYMYKVS